MKKKFKKICPVCKSSFKSMNVRKMYCSNACNVKASKERTKKEYSHNCLWCNNGFVSFDKKTKYCSFSCSAKAKNFNFSKMSICKECGIKFKQKHTRNHFCSQRCKSTYNSRNVPTVPGNCSYCSKNMPIKRKLIGKQENFFCSKLCESSYRSDLGSEYRICEQCGNDFRTKKSTNVRMCSVSCQIEWQKENMSGENNPRYDHNFKDRIKKCLYCEKEISVSKYRLKTKRYCSRKCLILSGNSSMTNPHISLTEMLIEKNIFFEIEYSVGNRFYVDCYVSSIELCIEVMGNYWHCNSERYKSPINESQKYGIEKDIRKREYIKSLGMNVLYLWEKDITENPEMCKKIIELAIKNKGSLPLEHSNYYSIKKGKLVYNENSKRQFMDIL